MVVFVFCPIFMWVLLLGFTFCLSAVLALSEGFIGVEDKVLFARVFLFYFFPFGFARSTQWSRSLC